MGYLHLFAVVILFAASVQAIAQVKGRLLTPDEGCGFSKVRNTKIVGGIDAKLGAFPWIARIGYTNPDGSVNFRCGGTLITSRHVLTAAHCLFDGLYVVRLGDHDQTTLNDESRVDIKVKYADKYPEFELKTLIRDIAILYLEHDVEFTDRISPICLPLSESFKNESFMDKNPFVAGWGRQLEIGRWPKVLQQAQVPVINMEKCVNGFKTFGKYYNEKQFDESTICAGHLDSSSDACLGDSGGPLMLPLFENGKFPFYQIGVISVGVGCARRNTPSIYTRISYYADWIKDRLRY